MRTSFSILVLFFITIVTQCPGKILHKILMEQFLERKEFSHRGAADDFMNSVRDSGHAINCGPPETKLNFTWTPKVLNPQDGALFTADMYATVPLSSGNLDVTVYFAGSPYPIFSYEESKDCNFVKQFDQQLKCPVKPKDHLKFQFEDRNLSRIPTGNYTIVAKVTNEKKQLFVCANVTISITDGLFDTNRYIKL